MNRLLKDYHRCSPNTNIEARRRIGMGDIMTLSGDHYWEWGWYQYLLTRRRRAFQVNDVCWRAYGTLYFIIIALMLPQASQNLLKITACNAMSLFRRLKVSHRVIAVIDLETSLWRLHGRRHFRREHADDARDSIWAGLRLKQNIITYYIGYLFYHFRASPRFMFYAALHWFTSHFIVSVSTPDIDDDFAESFEEWKFKTAVAYFCRWWWPRICNHHGRADWRYRLRAFDDIW